MPPAAVAPCRPVRLPLPVLLFGAIWLLALAPLGAGAAEDYDHWYVLKIDGNRAGWSHMSQETLADRIVTRNDTSIEIRRGAMQLAIRIDARYEETPGGEPLLIEFRQNLGVAGDSLFRWTWHNGEVRSVRIAGGEESPIPSALPAGGWSLPAEAARDFQRRRDGGEETISQVLLQPAPPGQLTAVTSTYRNFEKTTTEVFGRTVPALRVESEMSMLPGVVSISFLDEQGIPIRTSTPMPGFGEMTMLLADRELALADVDPPELMVRTMIAPDRPIPDARRSTRARYLLTATDGSLPDLPSTGAQRFERLAPGSGRIRIDVADPLPAQAADAAQATGDSALIDIDDARVVALAEQIPVDSGADAPRRAEAIRRFVHDYIDEKSLGVGLASAPEVCQTKEGDCTEHAVLLAALLRRHDIPARVAIGLLYVDSFVGRRNVFGYHMWTQALVEDEEGTPRWVDLDAVLPPHRPTDATHVALAVSNLADDEAFHAMMDLLPIMGTLEVRVEHVE